MVASRAAEEKRDREVDAVGFVFERVAGGWVV